MVFKCIIAACILFALSIGLVACAGVSKKSQEQKQIGVIEAVNLGCYSDGICSMKISGEDIVFGRGWSREIYGELIGFDKDRLDSSIYIGKKVEVFGRKTEFGIMIDGSKDYYIKLID